MRPPDLSRLLKKGKLTGKEAGRLVLADSHEVDHGRKGFLNQKDVNAIRASLTGRDIDDYNAFIETYRVASFTLKEARAEALTIEKALLASSAMLTAYREAADTFGISLLLPEFVTQEEYDNIKEEQKKERLKSTELLESEDGVINSRAVAIGIEAGVCGRFDELTQELAAEHPELEREARVEIEGLVKSGKLHVKRGAEGREEISVRELYELGLSPWVEWVEAPWSDVGHGFAVVQEPEASDEQSMEHIRGTRERLRGPFLSHFKGKEGKDKAKGYVRDTNRMARKRLRDWFAFVSVFEALSEYLGVNLSEDISAYHDSLMHTIELYNGTASQLPHITPEGEDRPLFPPEEKTLDVPPLHVDDLKPSKKMLGHLRERMALGLGNGWWEDAVAIVEQELGERAND